MIDENTFIISDTHFGHFNIVRFCNRPINHESIMLTNWENIVGKNDTILHLGDVVFDNKGEWIEALENLPGKKLLIKGNHDHTRRLKRLKNIFDVVEPFVQNFGGTKIFFSHYPDQQFEFDWDVNIHGHIHNNDYVKLRTHGKIYYNVSVEVMGYRPVMLNSIFRELSIPY